MESGDIILEDLAGHHFLFDAERGVLQALSWTEVAELGMFFEPTLCCIWHTLGDHQRDQPGAYGG